MVYRVYAEKKKEFAKEAASLFKDLKAFLKIASLKSLRIFNRYDAEGVSKELFLSAVKTVFAEPQLDDIYFELPNFSGDTRVFAYEYLPGQFDQRADSAAQCVQLISKGEKPLIRAATVIAAEGALTEEEVDKIKKYVINAVECREASLSVPATLKTDYPVPPAVKTLTGFTALDKDGLLSFIREYGLAMDFGDIEVCQSYFAKEGRDPHLTEIRVLDTYWSDHCRHTTFLTHIENAVFSNKSAEKTYERYKKIRAELGIKKPVTLMDMATAGAKYLKHKGILKKVDESEEINACTVKIKVDADGKKQNWLLLFKNETHNHPTEIEPFGGAATCIGGAIRDPLSGRSYVYQAMRVTGAGNPLVPIEDTLKGKLPQRKIVTTAANGYSSYGNQIGLATGLVDEIYHDGYVAKRLEIGAVIGAAPAKAVRRDVPSAGDKVILLGGKTGRDGCGGATGSSKSHSVSSIETCGAEVQKGNAPEERKLQRLFRNPAATLLIKRCNDFGAGGVAVAIGELADGLEINLDAVPKKYDGLDGTELAISESQERMAVVVADADVKRFIRLANGENLEATVVAEITEEPRLSMYWRGDKIVDLKREFLNSNGAPKTADIKIKSAKAVEKQSFASLKDALYTIADDLNFCSKRGLSERFDSTIGAGTVLMPFGGSRRLTPAQAMVAKLPVLGAETKTCSVMSYGFDPFVSEKSPYHGAYIAVAHSLAKSIAAGASLREMYLTFQEYFERPGTDASRWGKPAAALLGALQAQLDFGVAAIGGKDSMSGSFEKYDVPPTLVSFAASVTDVNRIISPELKKAGHTVAFIECETDAYGAPKRGSFLKATAAIQRLIVEGSVVSAYATGAGGILNAAFKMCLGNRLGLKLSPEFSDVDALAARKYGSYIVELADGVSPAGLTVLGAVINSYEINLNGESVSLADIESAYENKLESVFPVKAGEGGGVVEKINFLSKTAAKAKISVPKPRVLIPVFPGTNCEYDSARAFEKVGARPHIFVVKNRTAKDIISSAAEFVKLADASEIIFIPGGFSAGDEPDGSGKFITAFFRNPNIKDAVTRFLENDGLMGGICNGFQALIKLGLVPFGKITDTDDASPTLTYNTIGRHQSALVRTRIASNKSPWFAGCEVGDVYTVPISHGEGRFVCSDALLKQLAENGQIATQYCGEDGVPSMDIEINPNGSVLAVEGITSPDGRIFGKMAHSERVGNSLYKNVPGKYESGIFENAVKYFG
ncbi:MAG: phosphoribosylformylglycinamidine synthase [Clostridiaceae bacterium]|jgi:phosphoribosylformylglycinamidine synthase|nr:phosphoribosylformylglycinamidine synthase [Clostridiaceae bacterium]